MKKFRTTTTNWRNFIAKEKLEVKTMKLYFKALTSVALIIVLTLCIVPFCMAMTTASAATEEPQEIRYSGYGTELSTREVTSETISYTRKEESLTETVKGVPKYNQVSDLPNSCGPIAGAIVVGFYDKYYEDLIPDYTTYISSGAYKGRDSVYIPKLMRELYTLMRTNVDDVGVSETDCLNGLKSYVNGKGHSLSYINVKSGKVVSESAALSAFSNNHPVLLFCQKMDVYIMTSEDNKDTIACTHMDGAHVAVAYGIYIVNYYNGNTLFRTEKYLHIATGLGLKPMGYLKISSTDWCNAAYEVVVS